MIRKEEEGEEPQEEEKYVEGVIEKEVGDIYEQDQDYRNDEENEGTRKLKRKRERSRKRNRNEGKEE